jgi:hypothetical protein
MDLFFFCFSDKPKCLMFLIHVWGIILNMDFCLMWGFEPCYSNMLLSLTGSWGELWHSWRWWDGLDGWLDRWSWFGMDCDVFFLKMHFPCIAAAQSKDIPSELRKSFQELQNPKPLRGHGSPVGCHAGAVTAWGLGPTTSRPLRSARRSPIAETIALPFFQKNAAVEAGIVNFDP